MIKTLNRAWQECKQTRPRNEAWGTRSPEGGGGGESGESDKLRGNRGVDLGRGGGGEKGEQRWSVKRSGEEGSKRRRWSEKKWNKRSLI